MKTALVLSGGGMFGAYQAGAWKALSRTFSPDMVVGVSVGALNGWLVAAGASGDDLARQWLDPASGEMMTYRPSRWARGGIFDPRPLERRVKLLVESYKPRIDFGVALVRLPRLGRKLARNEEVTWRHLVASCAVPGGFPPVRIGSAFYCDGGLLEATPVWAAVEMGATRVIAVNASRFVPPPGIGMLIKGVRMLGRKTGVDSWVEVVTITPQREFGTMREGAVWRLENIQRWIEMGEADAGLIQTWSR